MIKKTLSLILVVLHIFTFACVSEGLAAMAESATYKLVALSINEGAKTKESSSDKIMPETIGEAYYTAVIDSAVYSLQLGYVWTAQSNPPIQTPAILNFTWKENASNTDALDLDDYFSSADGLALTYAYAKKTNDSTNMINVAIDAATHKVSFSQPQTWSGAEHVKFTATDTEGNSITSNEITLQVEGVDNAPVIDYIADMTVNENDLATITVRATDLDDDDITFSYSNSRFSEQRRYKENGAWYSEATWQTDYASAGVYTITITATDTTNLKASRVVNLTVNNINRPPVVTKINGKTVTQGQILELDPASENDLVVLAVEAQDLDIGDTITYSYTAPFDQTGKWQTDYNSSGVHNFTIKVSDGIVDITQAAKIIINNVNRPPVVSLAIDKATAAPNEDLNITLNAQDLDGDSLTYSIKKDNIGISSGVISGAVTLKAAFTNIGDHTISASVNDGALTTTALVNIDVYDPGANRDLISPVMGDFNGDALSDLGLHNAQTGTWEICISDRGQFTAALDWRTDFGITRDWIPIGGDFNGDAKTDIGIYNSSTGELKIALSTGSSFGEPATWADFDNISNGWIPLTGNFNGDKYTDFGLYNKNTGECKIALSNSSSFGVLTTWIAAFGGGDYIPLASDYNADGLTDLCIFQKSTGTFKIAFSNSARFIEEPSSWLTGFAQDKDPIISDFNNDGLPDVGYWDKSTGNWFYAPNTGSSFAIPEISWFESFGSSSDESAYTGDFNGDGITDAAVFDRDKQGINRWTVKLSTTKPQDLLVGIDNGTGGKTQVTYDYAGDFGTQELPFPVYVAKTISLINTAPSDRQATYTQNFTYEGGYFDAAEREFRGFRSIKVTDPITGNYTQTTFYQGRPGQDGALKGQIEKILSYDGNGKLISQVLNTWEVRKAGPTDGVLGFPHLIEVNSTVYEENSTYIETRNKFKYDNLGNITEETAEGDLTTNTDNKITTTLYNAPYLAGYNRPNETALRDVNNALLAKKTFEYDDYGNLKKETAYLDGINDPTTEYIYDSFGNVRKTTNASRHTVETTYESTFNTFPETITNELGHQIKYEYNAKLGAITKITDVNNQATETVYDSLARIMQQKNTQGEVMTNYSYPDFNTKITTQLNLSKTEYADGLGRLYQTISDGENDGQPAKISSEVYFDERGLKKYEVLAHVYSAIPPNPTQVPHIEYQYDTRGRSRKTISYFSAGRQEETEIIYLSPLCALSKNPKGIFKGVKKDVYGNTIEIIENTGNTLEAIQDPNRGYHTRYEYGLKSNLTKITDNQGNITQVQYDTLGRKTSLNDPDTGITSYTYDKLGNLLTQTDNKGQTIIMEYDVLSRLKTKSSLRAAGEAISTLVTYEYDDTTKPNCLGRLSKVTSLRGAVGDEAISTSYFYDTEGRAIKLDKTIDGQTYTTQTTYDLLGRVTSITYPDTEIINYTYDSNSGLLEKVQGAKTYVKDITYNIKSQIRTIKYGNDVVTTYGYGDDLRLAHILTESPAQTAPLQDLYYMFDLNGNIETITDNNDTSLNKTRRYYYDELNRLKQVRNAPEPTYGHSNFEYRYDSVGNMTYQGIEGVSGKNMTYNPQGISPITQQGQTPTMPHAVRTAGSSSYSYDLNGNMLNGPGKIMTYDVENRMVKLETPGGITQFAYDADGARIKKISSSETVTYISTLYEIHTTSNTTETVKHIFAGANRVATVSLRGSPEGATEAISYFHSDHLGSSNIITNEQGAQVSLTEYTPYGTIAKEQGSFSTPYKFTGKELDNTGLYFYAWRYYDPELGRFIQADTIIPEPYNPQTMNRYSYCDSNPLNYTDPTGHSAWGKFWDKVNEALYKFSMWLDEHGISIDIGVQHTERFGPGGNGSGGRGNSGGSPSWSGDTSSVYDESGAYNPDFLRVPETSSAPITPIFSGSDSLGSYDPLGIPAISAPSLGQQLNPEIGAIKAGDLGRTMDLIGPYNVMLRPSAKGERRTGAWWPKWIDRYVPNYEVYGGNRNTDDTFKKSPADSMDRLFMKHDWLWKNAKDRDADKILWVELVNLPLNPNRWEQKPNNMAWAILYREGAILVFGYRNMLDQDKNN